MTTLEPLSDEEIAEVRDEHQVTVRFNWESDAESERRLKLAVNTIRLLDEHAQLKAHAQLYDQECGMCGSDADELFEYMEWQNDRRQAAVADVSLAKHEAEINMDSWREAEEENARLRGLVSAVKFIIQPLWPPDCPHAIEQIRLLLSPDASATEAKR